MTDWNQIYPGFSGQGGGGGSGSIQWINGGGFTTNQTMVTVPMWTGTATPVLQQNVGPYTLQFSTTETEDPGDEPESPLDWLDRRVNEMCESWAA